MQGRDIALIIIIIALSQVAMALLYLRKKALIHPTSRAYARWKPLLLFSLVALFIGIIFFVFPEQYWLR